MALLRSRAHEPNDAISTLSQLFRDGVALVDDEVLVEDLEGSSTL